MMLWQIMPLYYLCPMLLYSKENGTSIARLINLENVEILAIKVVCPSFLVCKPNYLIIEFTLSDPIAFFISSSGNCKVYSYHDKIMFVAHRQFNNFAL